MPRFGDEVRLISTVGRSHDLRLSGCPPITRITLPGGGCKETGVEGGTRKCAIYSITTNQDAIAGLFRRMNQYVGNLAPMPGIFPDYPAPVIRNFGDA
jgi:hypothetical protein